MIDFDIRTRGWTKDYSFLLQQKPRIPDWNYYRSDIEKPTCILEGTGDNQVYLFLSGIPSVRKDHQGTPIRYDLVATISYEPWDEDSEREKGLMGLTQLIWIWLQDVRTALQKDRNGGERVRLPIAGKSELGASLDKILSQEYVEELLQPTSDLEELENNKNKLNEELKQLILGEISQEFEEISQESEEISQESEEISQESEEISQYWWGGVNNDKSCQQWIALVEKLLQGKTKGKALLLNIANPLSLGRLAVKHEKLGVLLGSEFSGAEPEEIEIKQARENKPTTLLFNFANKAVTSIKNKAVTDRKRGKEIINSTIDRVKKKRP